MIFPRRGRTRTSARRTRAEPGGTRPEPVTDTREVGSRFRAPSKLHAFNRYELKYLVPATQVAAVSYTHLTLPTNREV